MLFSIYTLLFLHACDGGGGGGNNKGSSGNVNPGLSGYIYLDSGTTEPGRVLEVATGETRLIPGMEKWDQQPDYTGLAFMSYAVSSDGLEVVETVQDCEPYEPGSLYNTDCIIIHRADNGKRLVKLKFFEKIEYPAKLSRDRQYLAFAYDEYDNDNISLHIHGRDGKLISKNNLFEGLPDSIDDPEFDWLPDGRLIYIVDQTIYLTSPYDTHGTRLVLFTESQGVPRTLAVSPDGKELAFVLDRDNSPSSGTGETQENTSVWVMSIDNSADLHELAVLPNNKMGIDFPIWSPDGRWIAVTTDLFNGGTGRPPPGGVDLSGRLYAVPSDGVRIELTEEKPTVAKLIVSNSYDSRHEEVSERFHDEMVAWVHAR
jgi:Tol biopolymer transport system component